MNHNTTVAAYKNFNTFYVYRFSSALAVSGAVCFSIISILLVFLHHRLKTWFFWCMTMGAGLEALIYTARAYSVSKSAQNFVYDSKMLFPVTFVALVSVLITHFASSLVAAAWYMTFGRLVWWVTPEAERQLQTLWVPARWIVLVFVSFDLGSYVVLFIDRNVYSGIPSQKKYESSRGEVVQKAATAFQLLGLTLFTLFAIRFMFVSKRWRQQWPVRQTRNWRYLGWATVASSILMTSRMLYRIIHVSIDLPKRNYLKSQEWPFSLFHALPTLMVFIIFLWVHPGGYLPARSLKVRLKDVSADHDPPANRSAMASGVRPSANRNTSWVELGMGSLENKWPPQTTVPGSTQPDAYVNQPRSQQRG